ncbi:MAG: rhomboid family intramembrane serine protease [Planctomycetaceae bacterium]|jgi:membrane associated rhomboid family serine protease|nr:rhomboid family intramembrane serine protease [Planctomycetaceae bacterium]
MGLYDRGYYQNDQDLDIRPSWNQQSAVSQLIILNVIVFVVNLLFGNVTKTFQGSVNEALALRSDTLWQPWTWYKAITYAFTHSSSDISHIFFNMLSLYFMGRSVEMRYGRREFLRIYLLAALFCGVMTMLVRAYWPAPAMVLGASGAVLCISMLFVYNFPNATVYLIVFPMPAWVLGIIFVLTNFFSSPGTGVAYDVHLFGILFATMYFFLGWSFSRLQNPMEGVTSIQKWWKRRKFKLHVKDDPNLSDDELEAKEADRILEKIHASGKDSLTSKEKKFLEKYSQNVRNRKRQGF